MKLNVIFWSLLAAAAALSVSATPAPAHGLGWNRDSGPWLGLSFSYGDGEPLGYGEVLVFSPAESDIPYQKTRADRQGRAAFQPDRPGTWTFSASDGQGHKASGQIEISADWLAGPASKAAAAPAPAPEAGSPAGPRPLSVALGLSLLANVGLAGLWRRGATRRTAG